MLAPFAPARPLLAIADAVQVMVAADVNPAVGNGGLALKVMRATPNARYPGTGDGVPNERSNSVDSPICHYFAILATMGGPVLANLASRGLPDRLVLEAIPSDPG